MDINDTFEHFLRTVVNLNPDRFTRIEDAQRILSDFVARQEGFRALYIDTVPQGSFRQKTIIKPVGEDGTFDVDLLVKLRETPHSWCRTKEWFAYNRQQHLPGVLQQVIKGGQQHLSP